MNPSFNFLAADFHVSLLRYFHQSLQGRADLLKLL
jgi:hypothetical protein